MNRISLSLLDSIQGQPLQSWTFERTDVVRIGRGPDNDVSIASPYVSRAHACIQFDGPANAWLLSVLSQQGVYAEGKRVDSLPLDSGAVFRLSSKGPFLRIADLTTSDADEPEDGETISVDPNVNPLLSLDVRERDRQVNDIAAGSYFQNLQQLAEQLRRKNKST